MKITKATVTEENLEITRPYTIAFKTVSSVENGIIRLTTDTGLTGYGAFNPCYEVIGEHLEDALTVCNNESLEWLLGKDFNDFDDLIRQVQLQYAGSISGRTGIEIALYDLYAQHLGLPLVKVLGQQIDSMPTSITIGIKNVAETLQEADEYVGRKFRILKIKLGISLEEDLERLIKLRERFGYDIRLIIDANQGYDFEQLGEFCKKTAGLNIELIEQPLAAGKEHEMRMLRPEIKKLVAADESLIGPEEAATLSREPGICGFFNIKLMKCAGICRALQIADTGLKNQIDLMWGCNDESIVSITAALHTAFSCTNTRFIDLDGSLDLARDVVRSGFILKDGIMTIPERPGLGLVPLD